MGRQRDYFDRGGKLDAHKDEISSMIGSGMSQRSVAKHFGVSDATITNFVDRHFLAKSGQDHSAVSHLERIPMYLLAQNKRDKSKDYVVDNLNCGLKVYIDIQEYIDLKERAGDV